MENSYNMKDGSLTIMVPAELDHHQAGKLRAKTDMLIDTYHARHLIFDFSQTEFMDSSGIGVVIGRCRNMSFSGGDVAAKNVNERVLKIFSASGLGKIIKIME